MGKRSRGNGEGMVVARARKDGSVSYQVRWHHGSKRFTKTIRGSRGDANRELRKILAGADAGEHVAPERQTLEKWIDHWLANDAKQRVSSRTHERYTTLMKLHVTPALGTRQLQKVDKADFDKLYADLGAAGLSPSTVRYVHVVLGRCFRSAIEAGKLVRVPNRFASRPKVETASGGRALTQAELEKLMNGLKTSPHYPVIALVAGTGARINEILALAWSAVDWKSKTLRIDRAVKPVKNKLTVGPPKTKHSRRTITIDDGLLALLKAEHERHLRLVAGVADGVKVDLSLVKLPDDALVFPAMPTGSEKLDLARLRRHGPVLKAVSAKATALKLGKVREHDLRHTHATLLLQAGVPVAAVTARLGHANAGITLSIYTHSTSDAEAAAAKVAGSLLANVLQPR